MTFDILLNLLSDNSDQGTKFIKVLKSFQNVKYFIWTFKHLQAFKIPNITKNKVFSSKDLFVLYLMYEIIFTNFLREKVWVFPDEKKSTEI